MPPHLFFNLFHRVQVRLPGKAIRWIETLPLLSVAQYLLKLPIDYVQFLILLLVFTRL
jgi:hypothetical protein